MKTYKVIKPFFKLSNRTNYFVGDTIDLTDMEAEAKKYEGLVEDIEVKEPNAKKKKDD